jgi:hypothetical protein
MSEYKFEFDESSYYVLIRTKQHGNLRFDWFNTVLYTHSKLYEYLDHVIYSDETMDVELDEGEFASEGLQFWRARVHDFDTLKDGMIKYDFPHFHSPVGAESDIDEYVYQETKDLRKDKFP